MSSPRFIMIGGFLGAGKTTTIARLARHYQSRGSRVAIVTNDQATDLVDTLSLRSQGFDVGEVPGSCFCCNFNALTDAVENLSQDELPDVVIAEPVGSCTDLVATVLRPLVQIYKERTFEISPYGVILKPSHGEKILKNLPKSGFSPKAAYIFRKQIEEADFVMLNRIDEMSPERIRSLVDLLQRDFPGRPVFPMSAKTGEGFQKVCEHIESRGVDVARQHLELDYDIYAEGEAELGWLNSSLSVHSEKSFPLDELILEIIRMTKARLEGTDGEVAHLKVIGMHDSVYAVANLVASDLSPELSLPSQRDVLEASLVINVRVATDPADLAILIRSVVGEVCKDRKIRVTENQTQSFRPGRPVPTHRLLT